MKDEDGEKKTPIWKIILMFFLSGVLFGLRALLILSTWGTGLGRIIIFVMGLLLIVVGVLVMVGGIRDLVKALKS